YYVLESSRGYFERGTASWYGEKFHGKFTSSGEPYDMYAMTAAHRTLPLPTYVRVTNLRNGRSVVVKVNDRGPFHDNRLIDLSYVAAAKLDMLDTGTAPVEVRAIDPIKQNRVASAPAPRTAGGGIAPAPSYPSSARPDTDRMPLNGEDAKKLFYVQMGAFSQRRNAVMLRSAVESSGAGAAHIQRGTMADGTPLYRVRVGPLSSRTEAERMKEQLAAAGIGGLHIVTEPGSDRKYP
ncbi:MAG TPA: septal ring lytic transglycosylase RlpA family protein, partial [Gammaproteobacteria bacterium]|nr:septal ring lytic transglycosylase RlpA family protein [Gammaproteobacteria bacterium]